MSKEKQVTLSMSDLVRLAFQTEDEMKIIRHAAKERGITVEEFAEEAFWNLCKKYGIAKRARTQRMELIRKKVNKAKNTFGEQ